MLHSGEKWSAFDCELPGIQHKEGNQMGQVAHIVHELKTKYFLRKSTAPLVLVKIFPRILIKRTHVLNFIAGYKFPATKCHWHVSF